MKCLLRYNALPYPSMLLNIAGARKRPVDSEAAESLRKAPLDKRLKINGDHCSIYIHVTTWVTPAKKRKAAKNGELLLKLKCS